MNENDKSRSGLQTAVDFAHAARAAKRIMQAAAASGVHGAAAATAREAFPLLLKVLIAVLVVFIAVPMLYYADTMQAKAMKLMASKLAVAGIIEGTFSEEGLAAMSDVKDLTSQMAKELALGIRDNVEDIAAAFRKMAVMNPERKKNIAAAQLKETAAEEQKAPAAKDSFGVRTAQAQVRQALYEGLLARTAEEQKKRKSKKAEVDENQLSIFGFAA